MEINIITIGVPLQGDLDKRINLIIFNCDIFQDFAGVAYNPEAVISLM